MQIVHLFWQFKQIQLLVCVVDFRIIHNVYTLLVSFFEKKSRLTIKNQKCTKQKRLPTFRVLRSGNDLCVCTKNQVYLVCSYRMSQQTARLELTVWDVWCMFVFVVYNDQRLLMMWHNYYYYLKMCCFFFQSKFWNFE